MAKRKNKYRKAASKKELSGIGSAKTGEKLKNASVELGKDIAVGVVGGGVAGAVLGRLSFLVGAAVTGIGHFAKNRLASALGLGMMASGTYQAVSGINGKSVSGLEGVKERLLTLKDDMKRRVFLDKILKAKAKQKSDESTSGLGQVQYFVYPNSEQVGALNMGELDEIENQIHNSAENFRQVNGLDGDMLSGELGSDEKIY